MSIPGSNIRLLREQRGLSLRSLAKAADVDPSTLSLLERGLGGYSREGIEKIARELDVSLGMLFAEPVMVEAAALRMRRLPLLNSEQLLKWKGEPFDSDGGPAYLHIDLDRGSRYMFGFFVTDSANLPEFRKGDVLLFDAARQPASTSWVIAQDDGGSVFIGRFRLMSGPKASPQFEVVPVDLSFPIGMSVASPSLKLRGTLIELRRAY